MPDFTQPLRRMLARVRLRLFWRHLAWTLPAALASYAILVLAGLTSGRATALAGIFAVLSMLRATHRVLTRIDARTLVKHLDRRFPEFEESTGLLLVPEDGLTTLQRMQRRRVTEIFEPDLSGSTAWLPAFTVKGPLLVFAMAATLVLATPAIHDWARATGSEAHSPRDSGAASPVSVTDIEVTITAPAYTQLPDRQLATLDLELAEGSELTWRLKFDQAGQAYQLLHSDGSETALIPGDNGWFEGRHPVYTTGLYRIVELNGDEKRPLEGIYTLTVSLDRTPEIRLLEPGVTVLEIPRDGPAVFTTEALVSDDYGLESVALLASVGKGSGEGVKFRDQTIEFASSEVSAEGTFYRQEFDLLELEMEPGDEIYFFVTAQDNREPEPNKGRSETVIVRWLDDAPGVAELAGLAIDVMPEYFKSQRQIIIETEALIVDQATLAIDDFDSTSRSLAQAQADLKQRYGQYLGDESEEGAPFDPIPVEAGDDHGADEAEARSGLDDIGHDHEAEGAAAANLDTSGGAAELIARFAHDHGASEIGPITARNPVGLMKRSISNMWQAELHLHLSEPELALPFEYEALKYLNLARQADRIYTRRLGFEPPPVSEERRLTGKLNEILEYQNRSVANPDLNDDTLFQTLFSYLSLTPRGELEEDDRQMLEAASQRLTALAAERPALIQQAATVEKILSSGSLPLNNCEGCTQRLMDTAWSLLQAPDSLPAGGRRWLDYNDPMLLEYLEASGRLP